MNTSYEMDVIAWANEQAELIRAGRLIEVDWENVAEEIEDVGKAEQREFAKRLSNFLALVLEYKYSSQLNRTLLGRMQLQRKTILRHLARTASFRLMLGNQDWQELVWIDAMLIAAQDTGLGIEIFPETLPWSLNEMLREDGNLE